MMRLLHFELERGASGPSPLAPPARAEATGEAGNAGLLGQMSDSEAEAFLQPETIGANRLFRGRHDVRRARADGGGPRF